MQAKCSSINKNVTMLSGIALRKLKQTWSAISPWILPSLLAHRNAGGIHWQTQYSHDGHPLLDFVTCCTVWNMKKINTVLCVLSVTLF